MKSNEPRKIVMVIATLAGGGAERVMSLLSAEWIRRGNEVTLITFGAAGNDHYTLMPEVKRIALDVLRPSRGKIDAATSNLKRLWLLRTGIARERPDVIISFMDVTNVLTLLATRGLGTPVIVSERNDPRHYPVAAGWDWLRRKLYPRASAVVVQTESVAEWAREIVLPENIHVISNPVSGLQPVHQAAEPIDFPDDLAVLLDKPYIAAMGRLDKQKGFDLLLSAFAALHGFDNVHLLILGEGPDRQALTNQAAELGIADRIHMPGRILDPFPLLSGARLFVLSSRFEGFPNALIEAMAMGLPVISFDCPSGPAEIIINGENGLLVETTNAMKLSEAIAALLRDQELRSRLGPAARQSIDKYSLGNIANKWEQLFCPRNR